MTNRVITANRLEDGAVVWLDQAGIWVREVGRAAASDNNAVIGSLLSRAIADEKAGRIISPYEVEIAPAPRGAVPVRPRERIRAFGPTVEPEGSA